jgi:hypothetical protein
MVRNSLKQTGSTYIVIVIILAIALIATLGFIFWQNFINKEPVTQQADSEAISEEQEPAVEKENKTFTNAELSFEYPDSGWEMRDLQNQDEIVRMISNNYKPNEGMGLESGAVLDISHTNQQEVPNFPGVKDVQEVQIDGNKGYKYVLEYEGYRLKAFFTVIAPNGEKNYAITMETAGNASDDQVKAFELVLNTIDIK